MDRKKTVLIVEDDSLVQETLRDLLHELGYAVCAAADTADKAVALAAREDVMAVLMDVQLRGGRDGIEAAREIRRRFNTPIVFLTGSNDTITIKRIFENHPAAVLIKPVVSLELGSVLSDIEKSRH